MSKEIKALKALVAIWESNYEDALQIEEDVDIAYREGYIDGLKRAITVLESKREE